MVELLVFYGLGLISVVSAGKTLCHKSALIQGYYRDVYFHCAFYEVCCGLVTERECCFNKGILSVTLSLMGVIFVLSVIGVLVWRYSRPAPQTLGEDKAEEAEHRPEEKHLTEGDTAV